MKPTTDTFLLDKAFTIDGAFYRTEEVVTVEDAKQAMILFAKMHVEAALRTAADNAKLKVLTMETFLHGDRDRVTTSWIDMEGNVIEPDKESIINTPYIVE